MELFIAVNNKNWTPGEITRLKEFYEDPDIEIEEIVKILGRSDNAIRLKASRLGFMRPQIKYLEYVRGDSDRIKYDYLTNTLTIMRPVDIDEVLDKICEIMDLRARGKRGG